MSAESRSMEAKARPETVWRIWSDPGTWNEWNPDVLSARLDGPFADGVTGEMRTKSGGAHRIAITGVAPGRSFQLETSPIPLTRFRFRCEVSSLGEGASTIRQSLEMEGPLAPLVRPMMAKRIADSFPAILQGLAAKAERAEAE